MTEAALLVVTITAVACAAVMGTIAWRMARDERRRSEARIAALAIEIHRRPAPAGHEPDLELRPRPAISVPVQTGTRSIAAVVLGVFIVGAIAALAIFASGSAVAPTSAHQSTRAAPNEARTHEQPLELIALGHERDGDRLTVHGIVRNPKMADPVNRLTAVVFVFDGSGAFAASGRAPVRQPTLAPGAESTFVVAVPGAADVARYRVSFRTDDRVVPHVDRRARGETAARP